jgi:hypothetical protein
MLREEAPFEKSNYSCLPTSSKLKAFTLISFNISEILENSLREEHKPIFN